MAILKRFIPILFCCLIVLLCAVPAFAASGSSGTACYTPIPWDTIGFGTDYRAQDQFAASQSRTGQRYLTIDGANCSQLITSTDSVPGYIEAEVYATAGTGGFQLVARNFILTYDALEFLAITVGNEEYNYSATWRGQCSVMQLEGDKWQAVTKTVQGGSSNFGSGDNIAPLIARDIGDQASQKRYVYFDYLLLTVTSHGDINDGYFLIDQNMIGSIPYARSWLAQYNMTYEKVVVVEPQNPDNVSFVDWLVVAVGGFLNFELWEGFTLNQLIEFVVVIGLVLWFITLLI